MDLLGRKAADAVLHGSKASHVNRGAHWERNHSKLFQDPTTATSTRTTRRRVSARGFRAGAGARRLVTKMPVAVPRVPYRTPQEGNWQWVDLWNCLYRERILFVGQGVTEELGNQLVGTLLYLDSVSQKDLQMYINTCEGGQLVPSLALYDTMR